MWIESHADLIDHPKLNELCFVLSIKKHEAIGHLHLLWHFAMKYAWRDGDLRRFTARVICEAVGWDKDHDTFINALRETGWIEKEGFMIHDWLDYAGKLVRDRLYQEKRRLTAINGDSFRQIAATVPNLTVPNLTKDKDLSLIVPLKGDIVIPDDLILNSPEIKDWLEYKRQKGQSYKPKGLEALWRGLRAIPASKRREAVDHSMSNNWSGLFEKRSFENGNKKSGAASPIQGKYDHLS